MTSRYTVTVYTPDDEVRVERHFDTEASALFYAETWETFYPGYLDAVITQEFVQ